MSTDRRKKKRAPAHLPEPRGRRGHRAVDEQPGLRDWLIERLQRDGRPTLDEIVEDLKATGFSVGRTAVWRFRMEFERQLAERDLALRMAKEYAAISDDEPLAVETAIAALGNTKIFETLRNKADLDEDAKELLKTFAKLQSSAALRERTKSGIDRGVQRAMRRIKAQMEERFKKNPGALKAVLDELAKTDQEALR